MSNVIPPTPPPPLDLPLAGFVFVWEKLQKLNINSLKNDYSHFLRLSAINYCASPTFPAKPLSNFQQS